MVNSGRSLWLAMILSSGAKGSTPEMRRSEESLALEAQ